MNLFWKRVFGGYFPTERYEEFFRKQYDDLNRLAIVRGSKEVAEHAELFAKVKSAEFKENKRTLTSRKYRDTQYYRDSTKFNKLDNNKDIKRYYDVLKMPILKEYLAIKGDISEYVKLSQPKELEANPKLRELKTFERSRDFKIYTRFHDSYIIKEYEALKEKISTPEFKKGNEFWSNPLRWRTTKEAQVEKRYNELCANEDVKFYLRYNGTRGQFGIFEDYELAFEERFRWDKLENSKWKPGFHMPHDQLKSCYSFVNQKQANNNGKNVRNVSGRMEIAVRANKTEAPVWNSTRGFEMHPFDFTGDTIQGHDTICLNQGIFRAKISFLGSTAVNHTFWLAGERPDSPVVIVAMSDGKCVRVGIKKDGKFIGKKIRGLRISDAQIYSVALLNNEIVWQINNVEVYRTDASLVNEPLFPMFSSFVPQSSKGGEGVMMVEYMQAYKLR